MLSFFRAIAFLKELFDLFKQLFSSIKKKKIEKAEGELADAIEKNDVHRASSEFNKL